MKRPEKDSISIQSLREILENLRGSLSVIKARLALPDGEEPKKTGSSAREKAHGPGQAGFPVRIGWIIPNITSGGVTRGIVTTTCHADARKIGWSGIVTHQKNRKDSGAFARLESLCRIDEGPENFLENLQALINRSDVLMLWGQFRPEALRDMALVDWKSKPVVLRSHGGCIWTRQILAPLFPYATHYMAVSRFAIRPFPPSLRSRVKILYNGVDLERTNPSRTREEMRQRWGLRDGEIAVGYYGRYSQEKNSFAAARAVRRLGQPYRSVYIGNSWSGGPGEEPLRRVDPDAVTGCEQEQIGNTLAGIDVFVLASHTEGHAQSLIECWQAGVPVVATPVGAVPELEEQYGPLVVRVPLNPSSDQLAGAVQTALSPENRKTVENARTLARQEFTATAMVSRFQAFIESIVRRPGILRRHTPQPIKAAIVTHALWIGGAERWIASLIKHSDPARIQWTGVAVIGRSGVHPDLCREILPHAPIYGIRGAPPERGRVFPENLFTGMHKRHQDVLSAAAGEADLLVSWGTPRKHALVRDLEKPLVLVSHTTLRFAGEEREAIPSEIHLAAVSEAAKEFFIHRDGAEGKTIEVIWNGVEEYRCWAKLGREHQRKEWGAQEHHKIIGYLGRQSPEKNYLAAARALTALPEDYRAVYYGYCIRTGETASDELKEWIRKMPGRVSAFSGQLFMGDVLAGLDCLLNVSHQESFGLSMAEAWLAGTPTISTPIGIVPEFNRRFGPLTITVSENPSPEELAAAIRRATGPEGRDIAQRAKRVAMEHLTAGKMAERWTAYFERLVKKEPVPFVIVSEGRCGSRLLARTLNTHSRITCYDELLNPSIERYSAFKSGTEYLSRKFSRAKEGSLAVGFKMLTLQGRKPPVADTRNYLHEINARVIFLERRNLLRRFVSGMIAGRTGIWYLDRSEKNASTRRVTIDIPSMFEDFRETRRRCRLNSEEFAAHEFLTVYYEDLCENFSGQMKRVFDFLGVEAEELMPQTARQETRPLKEIITNYGEVAEALRQSGLGEFLEETESGDFLLLANQPAEPGEGRLPAGR